MSPQPFLFEWRSSTGAALAQARANSWQGTATGTVTIYVQVAAEDFGENMQITVTPRTGWRTPVLNAPVVYVNMDCFGLYSVPASTAVPSIPDEYLKTGSGPWDGHYMTESPPIIPSQVQIHADYNGSGPRYAGASSTCATSSVLANTETYYR